MSFDEILRKPIRPSYILTLTYGYVGTWNNKLINFSSRGTEVFDIITPNQNLNTSEWIEEHRQRLISNLLKGLVENFNKRYLDKFDAYTTVVPLCHVISESIVIANSYFGESYY